MRSRLRLYCSFYLPGLPISLLQQRYDGYFDTMLGSSRSFLLRNVIGLLVKSLMLCLIPFVPSNVPMDQVPLVMLLVMTTIGTTTSCSAKLSKARGSDSKTEVSRT